MSLEEPSAPAARGDAGAPVEELWRHHADLQAVCLRMVGDPSKAEDLVQDTYLRALQQSRGGGLDRRESFGPWLATVARRRAIDELRWRRRGWEQPSALAADVAAGTGDDPVEQVLQQEVFERVRLALRELSPRERQLLLRQVAHGLTLAELAEEEDTSIASVRSVLSRARTKLRAAIERGGPLGAAPGGGIAAAVRERAHRVAARLESLMPSLTVGGSHFGDMVAAAIAAAVMLLGGASADLAPRPPVEFVAAGNTADVAALSDALGGGPGSTSGRGGSGRLGTPAATTPAPLPPPLASLPPGVDTPWLPYDQQSQPENTVLSQMVASQDGTVVFATGSPRGETNVMAVYRSPDGGRTWARKAGKSYGGGQLLLPPAYPAQPTLFAIASNGLFRSDDHGDSFSLVAPASRVAALSPAFSAGDPRIVLHLGGSQLGDYDVRSAVPVARPRLSPTTSVNVNSITFRQAHPGDDVLLVGAQLSNGIGYRGALFRCDANGCAQSSVFPETGKGPDLLISRAVPGVVLGWTPDALYRSADHGGAFDYVPLPPQLSVLGVADGAPGELFLFGANIHIPPGPSGLYRSTDGGRTWTAVGIGTPLQDGALALVRLPNGNLIVAKHLVGGLLCSTDNGLTWATRCP